MAIGVLSLAIGAVLFGASWAGISNAEPPRQEQKQTAYPYPKELA